METLASLKAVSKGYWWDWYAFQEIHISYVSSLNPIYGIYWFPKKNLSFYNQRLFKLINVYSNLT